MRTKWDLQSCADDALIERLENLARLEQHTLADVLAHLAEVDARTLYAERAYSSMRRYAVEHLGYSESAAGHRVTAARLARRFPTIFERVAAGALHLSGLRVLGPHLTEANHVELLDAAAGKTRAQIEELVAARSPVTQALALIAPAPAPALASSLPTAAQPASTEEPVPRTVAGATPVSSEAFAVSFTIDRAGRDLLAQAQDLLAHTIPDGDMGEVFTRALGALVEQLRKTRLAETDKPRKARPTRAGSRHIPAAVKRAAVARDGRRCTYVAEDGRRCTETARLEFHHEHPHGRGGPPTAGNIRLLCSTHNALLAERDYGREHIARKRARSEISVPGELVGLARQGLCQLGFKPAQARRAVSRAAAELDQRATLEALIRAALRHTRAAPA